MEYPGSVVKMHRTTMDTKADAAGKGKAGKSPAFNSGAQAHRKEVGINYGAVRKRTSNLDGSGANAHSNMKNPGMRAPGSKRREVYK